MTWEPTVFAVGGAFCAAAQPPQPVGVRLDGVSTLEIGSVQALPPDSTPEVINTGTKSHAVLHFKLPVGQTGAGISAITPAGQNANGGNIYQVHLSDGRSYEIVAPRGEDGHYVHTQSTAADAWVIAHNLGKYPSVTVFDSAGAQIVGALVYQDENTLTVTFSAAFAGKAYLN